MPSPFPGMDPYLEQPGVWETFHAALPAAMMGVLNRQIRPKYIAQIEQQVYIHELSAEERRTVRPDTFVTKRRGRSGTSVLDNPPKAPAVVRLPAVDVRKQKVVKIYDKLGGRVVTAIETLSPANKDPRADRDQYVVKREQYLAAHTNLVELDLLRGGERMPTAEPLPRADYYVLVCRMPQRERAEVWPIVLRDRLPRIPIPLDADDPDATLDLQSLVDRVYEDAGWSEELYRWKPAPPFRHATAEWVRAVLASEAEKSVARRSAR